MRTRSQSRFDGIPLRQLSAFESILRHGSINAAAADLNITSSAVSHRIAALEEALGGKLFTQIRSGVVLSAEGAALAAWVRPALSTLSTVGQALSATEAVRLEVLVEAGVPVEAIVTRLPEFLGKVDRDIRLSWTVQRQRLAGRGEADVRLAYAPVPPASTYLDALILLRAPDMADTTPVLLEEPRRWAETWQIATGVRLPPGARLSFSDPQSMVEACVEGVGVCVAPLGFVATRIATDELVIAHPARSPCSALEVTLTPQGRRKAVARLFAAWARALLASPETESSE